MARVSISQEKEVGSKARQVASAVEGDIVRQWKNLDVRSVFTAQR